MMAARVYLHVSALDASGRGFDLPNICARVFLTSIVDPTRGPKPPFTWHLLRVSMCGGSRPGSHQCNAPQDVVVPSTILPT